MSHGPCGLSLPTLAGFTALDPAGFQPLIGAGVAAGDRKTPCPSFFLPNAAGPSAAMAFPPGLLYMVRTEALAPVIIRTSLPWNLLLAWLA